MHECFSILDLIKNTWYTITPISMWHVAVPTVVLVDSRRFLFSRRHFM